MKRFLLILLASACTAPSASKLNVVTTTEDLAAIAREVGGDRVAVEAIARGYQDPHFVEPKPSFILRLQRADLLMAIGLQLEIGWLPPLVNQSRNAKVQPGGAGHLDVSSACVILDIPTGPVTRAMGDVHPLGNPHYWLDPDNGRRIAGAIEKKLAQLDAPGAAYYAGRRADFDRRLVEADKRWTARMAPYRGRKIITYHRSWPNFVAHFGLEVVDYVEPKPGIPPTPSHTLELVNLMRRENIKLILVEPYFDFRTPNSIAQRSGGQVVVLLPSVGGIEQVKDYFQLFDHNIDLLVTALEKTK